MPGLVLPLNPKIPTDHEFGYLTALYVIFLGTRFLAQDRGVDPRQAPYSWDRLRRLKVGEELVRWMLFQRHLDHLGPAAGSVSGGNGFGLRESLTLLDDSWFSLTAEGEAFADDFLAFALLPLDEQERMEAWDVLRLGSLTPRFDTARRIFTWGKHTLKHFRQPSLGQELVLTAAEELGWPDWMDDPLPPRLGANPKLRLRDTIKNLNRWQSLSLVQFRGNGTGTRVGWVLR